MKSKASSPASPHQPCALKDPWALSCYSPRACNNHLCRRAIETLLSLKLLYSLHEILGTSKWKIARKKTTGWFEAGLSLYGGTLTHLKTLAWAVPRADAVSGVHGTLSPRESTQTGLHKTTVKNKQLFIYRTNWYRGLRTPESVSHSVQTRRLQQNFIESIISTDKLQEVHGLSFYILKGLFGQIGKSLWLRIPKKRWHAGFWTWTVRLV